MPTYREKGIVLASKDLRDADRHYTIFTEGRGKIVVLAKGSRKGRSKMAPHMGAFGVVDLMVAQGRIIDRLAGASLSQAHGGIHASLEKMALAQGMLLAADALIKRELPDERIFSLLAEFLGILDGLPGTSLGNGRGVLFDASLVKLLDLLGFGLELDECVACRSRLVPQGNALSILRGGIECASCKDPVSMTVSDAVIKALRYFRSEPLRAVPLLRLSSRLRRELAFVIELLLTNHLESRFAALHYVRAVAG